MKQRKSRAERYESGEGHLCSWIPLAAAAVGAIGSYMASDNQNDAQAEAMEGAGTPVWDPRQESYLFGNAPWQPNVPDVNADALNYGQAMMGGYNPATGPQGPMSYQDILFDLLNNNSGQDGGVSGLLGYGGKGAPAAAPPPMMASNPYYGGQGVDDPNRLGYNLYGPAPQQAPQQPTGLPAAAASPYSGMPQPNNPFSAIGSFLN